MLFCFWCNLTISQSYNGWEMILTMSTSDSIQCCPFCGGMISLLIINQIHENTLFRVSILQFMTLLIIIGHDMSTPTPPPPVISWTHISLTIGMEGRKEEMTRQRLSLESKVDPGFQMTRQFVRFSAWGRDFYWIVSSGAWSCLLLEHQEACSLGALYHIISCCLFDFSSKQ